MSIGVGYVLQPEEAFLEHSNALLDHADYFEVAPETMWFPDAAGKLQSNGFHRRFATIQQRTGKPFVAHGVGFSLGSASPRDAARTRRWLDRMRVDHASFRFGWYTDHLGATSVAGEFVALPLALAMTAQSAAIVRRRLRAMQSVVPDVGVENTASYFVLGDPLDEPKFLTSIVRGARTHLLLDLHNVVVMAENLGFEPEAYLARVPLDRVIEIHVAGGTYSDPRWLPAGKSLRLDSHDMAIPEQVFTLLASVVRRCSRLRGVTLERMEGSVEASDVGELRSELRRIRATLRKAGLT